MRQNVVFSTKYDFLGGGGGGGGALLPPQTLPQWEGGYPSPTPHPPRPLPF